MQVRAAANAEPLLRSAAVFANKPDRVGWSSAISLLCGGGGDLDQKATSTAELKRSVRAWGAFDIRNDEICIRNDEICIKHDENCIKHDGFCIRNDEILH